jgi:hypothetical protein
MSVQPSTRRRAGRLAAGPVLAAVLVTALAAGCVPGSAAPPAATGAPSASVPATSTPASAPPTGVARSTPATAPPATLAASPTPAVEAPPEPPKATLVGAAGTLVAGTLGSYTWGDAGSDSPWIIVRAGRAAGGPGPWTLSFDPALPIGSWTAAWAGIRDGRPGPVEGYAQGTADTPSFAGPSGPEPRTLKVEVTFAVGGSAVYYWRLEATR